MTFPTAPLNGQTVTVNGISYTYTSSSNSWARAVPSTASTLNVQSFTITGNLSVTANIGIGTSSPQSVLDLSSRSDMLLLPIGTTAQRPIVSSNGAIRFNTSIGGPEWYYALTNQWFPFYQLTTYVVNYLVIAGGGGGGGIYYYSGGGGAGGMVSGQTALRSEEHTSEL